MINRKLCLLTEIVAVRDCFKNNNVAYHIIFSLSYAMADQERSNEHA